MMNRDALRPVSGANVFSAWNVEPSSLAAFRNLDGTSDRLGVRGARHLLEFSLLAPSTHNSVPQRYQLDLDAQRIHVWLRRNDVLPASDPSGREALISVGCAIENLVTAATQYGFNGPWTPDPELQWRDVTHDASGHEVHIGYVQFSSGHMPSDEARKTALLAMRDRKVIRAEFDATARLPPELVERLHACASSNRAVRLHLFETDSAKFAWGKLDESATKHKLEEQSFRRELGRWILLDDDTTSARGMRGREFGIDPSLTAQLTAQLRGEAPMAGDQLAFMARAARAGLTSSSAICALSCPDPGPHARIEAGRVYQRAALLALQSGFAHAVHTAVCEVPHVRKMCQATLLDGCAPDVVFRVGRPLRADDWLRPHSSRPQLDEMIHRDITA